jgi:hypothetical protein
MNERYRLETASRHVCVNIHERLISGHILLEQFAIVKHTLAYHLKFTIKDGRPVRILVPALNL